MGALKNVTDADFETEVVKNSKPVLVDFWAEWCGPCRMIAPILEEISRDHGDKLEIVKLNVDENPKTPGNLGIIGIPALFVYKDGQVVKQITGAKPKGALLRELADFI